MDVATKVDPLLFKTLQRIAFKYGWRWPSDLSRTTPIDILDQPEYLNLMPGTNKLLLLYGKPEADTKTVDLPTFLAHLTGNPPKTTVKLNDEYTATIEGDTIKVGEYTFTREILNQLLKARKEWGETGITSPEKVVTKVTPKLSAILQKEAFSNGIEWPSSRDRVHHTQYPYLGICTRKRYNVRLLEHWDNHNINYNLLTTEEFLEYIENHKQNDKIIVDIGLFHFATFDNDKTFKIGCQTFDLDILDRLKEAMGET